MSIKNIDNNRRDPNLFTTKIDQVLPEYFQEEHSTLVTFLEKYYDLLDSDVGDYNFSENIRDIYAARDPADADIDFLDQTIGEIGNGLKASSFFQQPRLMARLLGQFYQTKGAIVSAEGFFRGFFNEEAEIIYPKKDIFIVGESNIGFLGQKKIQDNEQFQIFSILVRSGLSVADYELLYKRFVHPAGFHFAGEVLLVDEATQTITLTTHNPLEEEVVNPLFLGQASSLLTTSFGETTLLYDSTNGDQYRVDTIQQELLRYTVDSDLTANLFVKYYDDIKTLLDPNSFRFDDSANTGRPDFAMTVETMDNDVFTRISSDSAI